MGDNFVAIAIVLYIPSWGYFLQASTKDEVQQKLGERRTLEARKRDSNTRNCVQQCSV